MKNFSKVFVFFAFVVVLSGCNKFTIATFQPDQNNGSDCPNPTYIATMSISAWVNIDDEMGFNQKSMTLVSLLAEARKKYGDDVTIHNIRWDIKNGKKKTGVIYDVIKCK